MVSSWGFGKRRVLSGETEENLKNVSQVPLNSITIEIK
jgi:hypothetical protein